MPAQGDPTWFVEFEALQTAALALATEVAVLARKSGSRQPVVTSAQAADQSGPELSKLRKQVRTLERELLGIRQRSAHDIIAEGWAKLRLGVGPGARTALLLSCARWLLAGELPRRLREHRAMRLLLRSGLFNEPYYLGQHPTPEAGAPIAIEHYVRHAGRNCPDPNVLFDNAYYLDTNPDVAASGQTPLLHFIEHGALEGRSPHPMFDTGYYLTTYPDVLQSGMNPLRHYLELGREEGRWSKSEPALPETAVETGRRGKTQKSSGAPRIIVMDYRIPRPELSAGEQATVGILRDLCALGYDVTFLPSGMEPDCEHGVLLESYGVTVVTRDAGYRSAADYIRAEGDGTLAFYLIRVDVAECVIETIRAFHPEARLIFHSPDVYFLRERREAELRNDPVRLAEAERTREREVSMMRRVDMNVIVSPAELPLLREHLPNAPFTVFPVLYAPTNPNPAPFNQRRDIFFLGGYAHLPNIDAVRWFVSEVWPLVRSRLPGVIFHIVGSEAPESVECLGSEEGVQFDGFVQDLEPLLSTMRLGVAPIRFGAGIKGKVAVTMGAGIPCVCTPIAAEGMGIADGREASVADDAPAFAEAVVELYADQAQWERQSLSGRLLVERKFGNDANRVALLNVLRRADALPYPIYVNYCNSLPVRPVPRLVQDAPVDVSIVVPVYNQWAFTKGCLNSILMSTHSLDLTFEVILADDGSTDETMKASALYPGLRVIGGTQNLGFLRNCNRAAKQAFGKYVLLLNNDTVVLPGWLEALFASAEEDPRAAIVGSKLLYDDETIQEAGGVLWNDATASNCGRYRPRAQPEFTFEREIDYVSGASILIRKSFWDEVGGFDERYENAYCEDSDLAMTARARGKRVIYQPDSEVIHFEHKSYSGERADFMLPVQRDNVRRLREKWKVELARDHLPAGGNDFIGMANAERTPSPSALARRRSGCMNVLYFSPFPSHPSNHGNQATIQQFGRYFQSMGHKVHFALLKSHLFTDDIAVEMRACWDTLDILENSHPLGADGNPIPFDGWYEQGLGEQIYYLCKKYDIDVVFCSYIFQSKLLEFVPQHILKVIDTHDKMGNRYEMLRANGQPLEFFSCTPEEEGAYMRRADLVVARREEEAKYFDSVVGRSSAVVVPHFEASRFQERTWAQLSNVGLVASANRINLAIVREFLEAIDRRLAGGEAPFKINIAGQVNEMTVSLPAREAEIFTRPWVRMHGFVPDIEAFYAMMDVMVAPVTMGTGINVKTVQAMAFGMPLLTTACGGKGIETGDPMHAHPDLDTLVEALLRLADRPEELARLAQISRDRYAAFRDGALASVRDLFAHPKLRA